MTITQAPQSHRNAAPASPAPTTAAKVKAAIDLADFKDRGVVIEPFWLYVVPGRERFANIWNSQRGSNPITFFQFVADNDYLCALGDLMLPKSLGENVCPWYDDAVLLLGRTSAHPEAVAHPIDFVRIADDRGDSNTRTVIYWRLVPPAGYEALGIAFSSSDEKPKASRYWCVKRELLRVVGKSPAWSDEGQHWSNHNGDLSVPSFEGSSTAADPGEMLVLPQTFFSSEDRGAETAYALAMPTMNLDVSSPTPEPFDADGAGARTESGVKVVKVVPFSAVPDTGVERRGLDSPFYYISAEPYWYCIDVADTPNGGTHSVTYTTGVTHERAEAFRQRTSMTVSAEVGASYKGGEAKVSSSFTNEFELTTVTSDSQKSEVSTTDLVNLPPGRNAIWEKRIDIVVYRTNGTILEPVAYRNPTTKIRTKPIAS
jgi:hypothetical protein